MTVIKNLKSVVVLEMFLDPDRFKKINASSTIALTMKF
jgi:hypothetical protein